MWLSAEDARSDFILAAAALVFGMLVFQFVASLRLYPDGELSLWLLPVWMVLLMVVPARFLAGYREQGITAYGLSEDRTGIRDGLLLVLPILVVGYLAGFSDAGPTAALLGRLRGLVSATPSLIDLDLLESLRVVVLLVVGAVGTTLLYGLLVVRGRDAFRPTEIPLLEALRTYGIGATALGTVLGLLLSVTGSVRAWRVLLEGLAMLAVVLLADRMVGQGDRTNRATVLAPAIVALAAFVIATGGGLFGPGLALGLYRGSMAAAIAVVFAVLLETRRRTWVVVPLVVATIWSPTCLSLPLSPVPLGCF